MDPQSENLGAGPPDEEQVPVQIDQGPPLFYFFGLGQQVLAPIAEENPLFLAQVPDQIMQEQQPGNWPPWPEELPAWGQHLNLNQAPVAVQQDLNEAPADEDLQEVLVHPEQDQNDQGFI